MNTRCQGQKELLRKIYISQHPYHRDMWDKAISKETMASFVGLRNVHVLLLRHLGHEWNFDRHRNDPLFFNSFIGYSTMVFRILKSLSEVTVVLRNLSVQEDFVPQGPFPREKWTLEHRREFAKVVERRLLDPQGAETWEQEKMQGKEVQRIKAERRDLRPQAKERSK